MKVVCYILLFLTLFSPRLWAQEESSSFVAGKQYISLKLDKLEGYNNKLKAHQERLVKKLKKKENRLLSRLEHKDSAAYAQLSNQPLSFDSLARLEKPDSATLTKKNRQGNKVLDSLKAINSFVSKQSDKLGFADPTSNTTSQVNDLQNELNYRKYVNDLISQRAKSIKGATVNSKISGLKSFEKKVFYAKQKMNALKEISEDPSEAEERALECLQGTEGFDTYMDKIGAGSGNMKSLSGNTTSGDLEKMGLQTKKQVQSRLKERFGKNMGRITQKMGSQVKEFQDKGKKVTNIVKEGKGAINDAKKVGNTLKNIEKPSFKVNPMRGKLFWQRIEKQYNWQTVRATADKPATLEGSAMAGFKHTPKLTYGLGVATSIGLGKGWDKIKVTFEGIGLRSFATWEWQYGIGAYAGYERMFKKESFTSSEASQSEIRQSSVHNTTNYSESMFVGLVKTYSINAKYKGAIQLLYDVWWKEKGLRSPIVLRFSTQSK